MRIDIAGWSTSGLRCPDVTIDLIGPGSTVPKVTLLQMPNGTGKTTTLEMLIATLSGVATSWDEKTVRSYRRKGDERELGTFVVSLLVDGRQLSIELVLDFEMGIARYRTTNPGSGGVVQSWQPLPAVRRFLAKEFLGLFVFNGEFAARLLDERQTAADDAIDALCQLYLLNEIGEFVEQEWSRRTKQAGAKSDNALTRLRTQLTNMTARRANIAKARVKAEAQVRETAAEIADLAAKIEERLGTGRSTREQFNDAKIEMTRTVGALSIAAGNAMQALRQPLAIHPSFATSLIALKDNLDNLRLPENTSAQFFNELLEESECICGREMTPGAKHEIGIRSLRYLDASESGVINAIKQDIGDFTAASETESPEERLAQAMAGLGAARRDQKLARQTVNALKQKLIDEGDEELFAWQQQLDKQTKLHDDCTRLLQEIDADDEKDGPAEPCSLKLIDKKIKEFGGKISEITETVTLRKQTDVIKGIMARTTELARSKIKAELIDLCNARLEKVLANDPLTIGRIDRSIRLEGQGTGSTAQVLAAGYVFLMSALRRGNNDFPLVVDSPANPMDMGRRRRIGSLIPELCSQFVAFTINTELPGFVPALADSTDEIRYLTMFRRTTGTARLLPGLPTTGVSQNDYSIVVEGKDYFMSFDVTDEEDD
ncbi:UNVERIFIED_ORG: DNA sulfur modification protein DndD [Rhizobium esperanzae]